MTSRFAHGVELEFSENPDSRWYDAPTRGPNKVHSRANRNDLAPVVIRPPWTSPLSTYGYQMRKRDGKGESTSLDHDRWILYVGRDQLVLSDVSNGGSHGQHEWNGSPLASAGSCCQNPIAELVKVR
jgi:hypothetical protein